MHDILLDMYGNETEQTIVELAMEAVLRDDTDMYGEKLPMSEDDKLYAYDIFKKLQTGEEPLTPKDIMYIRKKASYLPVLAYGQLNDALDELLRIED